MIMKVTMAMLLDDFACNAIIEQTAGTTEDAALQMNGVLQEKSHCQPNQRGWIGWQIHYSDGKSSGFCLCMITDGDQLLQICRGNSSKTFLHWMKAPYVNGMSHE